MDRAKNLSTSAISKSLKIVNQTHLLQFYNELGESEQNDYLEFLAQLDLQNTAQMFQSAMDCMQNLKTASDIQALQPVDFTSYEETPLAAIDKFWDDGLEVISRGEVCAMLVDNENTPAGLTGKYKPGLLSGKCLFQLHAEKITRLQDLAEKRFGKPCVITWYIMVNEKTIADYPRYFKERNYFGLNGSFVRFFEQAMLPCFDYHGGILLESKAKIVQKADGSGGLFNALVNGGLLNDIKRRGIRYILTYSTENLLGKIADPIFLGFCLEKKADCAAKMVQKQHSNDGLSTFCVQRGKVSILASKEIHPDVLFLKSSADALVFFGANIASYFITLEFLEGVVKKHIGDIRNHAIRIKVDYLNEKGEMVKPTTTNGITLKKYIFDVFEYCRAFAIWEVPRMSEYCALKYTADQKHPKANALDQFYRLHTFQIEKAGGFVSGKEVEVSPLLSYNGEGLEEYCMGKRYKCPVLLLGKHEKAKAGKKKGQK